MTITIPTSAQIAEKMEKAARIASIVAAIVILTAQVTYQAGYRFGKMIHKLNDWMANAIHNPEKELRMITTSLIKWAERVLETEQTAAAVLLSSGAILLTEEQLDIEIEKFERKPVARRKPATARKAKAAA
jgi:hypothetical protein